MLRITWNTLCARRRRLAGTAVAVVLGVGFLVGTLVLGDTIAANFDDLFSETAAGTDVVVRGESPLGPSREADAGRRPIDVSLADAIASVDGVAVVEPQVVGYGQLLGADGDPIGGNGPPRLAGSWITTPDLNPYQLAEGRPPRAADEVVINRGAAEDGNLSIGDRTVVQLPRPVEVTVVGISTFGGADGLGETTMAAFTLEAARDLLMRKPGTVSTVLVKGEEGQDADELRARVVDVLPAGVEAVTGEQIVKERLDSLEFLGIVRTFLVVFAVIALVVAALSINNAFSITVAQRTRELALLRAIGASRRQVRRMVRLEALLVGVAAAAVGVFAGIGMAVALKGVLAGFGLALPAGGLTIRPSAVVIGVVVGLAAVLVATRSPARRAARVAPVEALRTAASDGPSVGRRRGVAAAGAMLAGAALAAAGAGRIVALVGLGGLLLVAGTLLLAPVAVPRFAGVLGAVLRRTHAVNGALAEQNARRHPRRTANTASALTIGVAVVALISVFAASMANRIEADVSDGFGDADLAIATPAFGGGVLSPDVLTELDAVAEVERAVGVAQATVLLGEKEGLAAATDLAAASRVLDVSVVAGSLDGLGPEDLVVTETSAEDHRWGVGSTVDVTFPDGSTTAMTVAAVLRDTAVLAGVVLPTVTWFDHAPQPSYSSVFIKLAGGVGLDRGRAAIGGIARRYSGDVQDREEFAAARAAGLDMLLGLVYSMLALAIVIALVGIANALSMAVNERRREIGLLRAVGQTRGQARTVLRLESALVATFGTATGLLLGTVVGGLLFAATTGGYQVVMPWATLGTILVIGVVAGVLAAWRPARRVAGMDVLDAMATV